MTLAIRAGDPVSKSSQCPNPPLFPLHKLMQFNMSETISQISAELQENALAPGHG